MAADVLTTYQIASDSFILRYQYRFPEVFREPAALVEQHHFSVFPTFYAKKYRVEALVPREAYKAIAVPSALQHLVEAGTRAHDACMWLSIIYAERPDILSIATASCLRSGYANR
jgi:hypothetical protein